jgi:hypothetical protein
VFFYIHDAYFAVDLYPNDHDVHFAKMMGKTLVTHEMSLVGVPDLYDYIAANKGHKQLNKSPKK